MCGGEPFLVFSYHSFIWNFLIFLVDFQLFIFALFSKIENEVFWFEKECAFVCRSWTLKYVFSVFFLLSLPLIIDSKFNYFDVENYGSHVSLIFFHFFIFYFIFSF